MNLLVVAGFLGSGKTTLIISLARQMTAAGRKVAIIENEVGEIGIDGDLMRLSGLTVKELCSGCICCQLSADLVPTLEALAANFSPDWVIIEPSGVAEPKRMLAALPYYHGPAITHIRTLTLVDPTRLPELYDVLTPLVRAQIQAADLVVINKIDLAAGQLAETQAIIQQINPGARVAQLSARQGAPYELIESEALG